VLSGTLLSALRQNADVNKPVTIDSQGLSIVVLAELLRELFMLHIKHGEYLKLILW
jgi:hypothetical protein